MVPGALFHGRLLLLSDLNCSLPLAWPAIPAFHSLGRLRFSQTLSFLACGLDHFGPVQRCFFNLAMTLLFHSSRLNAQDHQGYFFSSCCQAFTESVTRHFHSGLFKGGSGWHRVWERVKGLPDEEAPNEESMLVEAEEA
jgi:hypothetical protein